MILLPSRKLTLISQNDGLANVNSLYKMAIFGIYVRFLGCIFFGGFAKETSRHTKPLCVIITSLSIDFKPKFQNDLPISS